MGDVLTETQLKTLSDLEQQTKHLFVDSAQLNPKKVNEVDMAFDRHSLLAYKYQELVEQGIEEREPHMQAINKHLKNAEQQIIQAQTAQSELSGQQRSHQLHVELLRQQQAKPILQQMANDTQVLQQTCQQLQQSLNDDTTSAKLLKQQKRQCRQQFRDVLNESITAIERGVDNSNPAMQQANQALKQARQLIKATDNVLAKKSAAPGAPKPGR